MNRAPLSARSRRTQVACYSLGELTRVAVLWVTLVLAGGRGSPGAAQPLTERIIALYDGKLLALDPSDGAAVPRVIGENVGYASLSPSGRFVVWFRAVGKSEVYPKGSRSETYAPEEAAKEEVVVRDCADPAGREQVLAAMPADAARQAIRERYVAWARNSGRLAFVGLNDRLDASVFVAARKTPAAAASEPWAIVALAATATARDQGLRVRSFSPGAPDGARSDALVCENRFSTYVVSLAGREPVPLPGVFHSWSPTGDALACNGDYAYPSHHGELAPYLLDTTMVGVPVVRLVSPQGRVRLEQRNAVFLRWSPDGAQMILRSTQPQRDAGLLLYLARTTATASTKATPLCHAPAWVTWHPGGELIAWSNARGCFVTNTRLKQTTRVTGSVAGGWCGWAPKADPPRLLYVDADHLQVADETGQVLARADNPLTSGERPRDGRASAPRQVLAPFSPSRPPELLWAPDGARCAISKGEGIHVYPLDRLAPETELADTEPREADGGPEPPHRPTQQARRLIGWTAPAEPRA